MRNKVDISKLIEKKYKGNTLELNDILEEIDLVLNETIKYDYTSKIDTKNLEENPLQGREVAYHNGAPIDPIEPTSKAPRKEIPGDLGRNPQVLPQVRPDKIAEAEGVLSTERQRTIKVPDLFSMITDPKRMSVGSADRELINNIMSNIGLQQSASWRERTAKIQNYINTLSEKIGEKSDISQLISSLIFLNLFKKISFFLDQPGKQFEYLFLPFLSPEAQVKGSEQKEIIDVTFGNEEYSLKFLTAAEPKVPGSRDLLSKKTSKAGYAKYLIAKVGKSGNNGFVEFAEFGVTDRPEWLSNNGYLLISGQSEVATGALWFETSRADSIRWVALIDPGKHDLSKFNFGVGSQRVKQTKKTFNVAGATNKDLVQSNIAKNKDSLSQINDKIQQFTQTKDEKVQRNLLRDLTKLVESVNKSLSSVYPEFKKKYDEIPEDKKNDIKTLVNLFSTFLTNIENLYNQQIEKPSTSSLQTEAVIAGSGTFVFPIAGIWNTIKIRETTIFLGSPEIYNKQVGYIAGAINNFYIDILENLDQLNMNITNYVATSSDTQKTSGSQTYAAKSIENAENIKKSVSEIESKKK